MPKTHSVYALIDRYEAIFLDAYGVLVNRDGPLPGAVALIDRLNQLDKPYFLVSNTAAHLPQTAAIRYQGFGFDLAAERILTAGLLIKPYFASQGLLGLRCGVLGPEDSFHYVEQAGAKAVTALEDFDVLLIGDQVGFPFLEGVDAALSQLMEKIDAGLSVPLILPNPDLIFPKSKGYGITSGMVALLIEAALRQRYPNRAGISFVHLGKPKPGLFELAMDKAHTRNALMIGDQIDTDIKGAVGVGLDSALVAGGVAGTEITGAIQPTYRLESLNP